MSTEENQTRKPENGAENNEDKSARAVPLKEELWRGAGWAPPEIDLQAELEKKIRKQVACEERAHRLVEQLLENPISENFLIEAGKLITPNHYQDVTEERAITKICGYPICTNAIKNMSRQKYKISTKTNKVYDISERKNFCSNQCYKSSQYFAHQIPTTPVWAREEESPPNINLLDNTTNWGKHGEEIFTVPREEVAAEVQQLERHPKRNVSAKPDDQKKSPRDPNLESIKPEITSIQDLAQQVSDMMLVDKPQEGSSSQSKNESDGTVHEKEDESERRSQGTQRKDALGGGDLRENESSSSETSAKENRVKENLASADDKLSSNAERLARNVAGENASGNFSGENPAENVGHVQYPAENGGNENPAENPFQPQNDNDADEGYDEKIVETPIYPKKRVAPELTSDKAATLMALIEKRERLKKQLKEAPKKPVSVKPSENSVLSPLAVEKTLGPLTIEVGTEQEERKSPESSARDLEKEFEEKLLTGQISEIKDLFSQITLTEKKENQKTVGIDECDEKKRLLSVVPDESLGSQSHPVASKKATGLADNNAPAGSHVSKTVLNARPTSGPVGEIIQVDEAASSVDPTSTETAAKCGSKPTHSQLRKEDTKSVKTIVKEQTDVQISSKLREMTSTNVKTKPKMTSASVIDNVRRLQEQAQDFDEDDIEEVKPKVKVKKKKRSKKTAPPTPVQLLKNVIKDWVTEDTKVFVGGANNPVPEMSRQEFNIRYAALERKVEKIIGQEAAEDEPVEDAVTRPQKKLPDYSELQKDTKLFDMKVREFFSGSFKYPVQTEEQKDAETTTEGGVTNRQSDVKPLLPLVDGRQQHQIRQKILMDRLDKVLPDILGPMKISIEDVTGDLRDMVSTFHLTSENILLKPAEWTLVSYLLLKMLACRNRKLQHHLNNKQSTLFIDIILNKIGSSGEEINAIILKLLQKKS